MNKTVKWILIVVAIFAGIALIIVAIKALYKPATPPPPGQPPVSGNLISSIASALGGLFSSDWIKNIFGGGNNMGNPACQSANPGFDNNGYYTKACGGVPGGGGANCDPNNPGKDMDGFLSEPCGGGARKANQSASMASINMIPGNYLSQMSNSEKNITQLLYDNINRLGITSANLSANQPTINKFIANANSQLKDIGSKMTISFIPNNGTAKVNCTGEECWEVNVIIFKYCHCRPTAK